MTAIHHDITLARLVDESPGAARILERYGLDYCCGGKRSLAEACSTAAVDVDEVAAALGAAPPEAAGDWTQMTATELVDHLESTHHEYLRDELPRVVALTEKLVSVHGVRHPELVDIRRVTGELRDDLMPHLLKEERVLFPMIRELEAATSAPEFHCGTLRNPISVMLSEHDRVGAILASLRRLTDDFTVPADGCATYAACFAALREIESDTHLHVHKENNVLFPLVVRLEWSVADPRYSQSRFLKRR